MKKYHDLKKYNFVHEPRYYFYGWKPDAKMVARQSAIQALRRARKFLPKGHNFKIWDAQRMHHTRFLMIQSFTKRLKILYPRNVRAMLIRFAGASMRSAKAKSRLDTHRNGGAFDLTIVNRRGEELFMGTDHDDLTDKAALWYYKNIKKSTVLEKEARKNRRILARAMKKAGFKEYPPEWWHWGYGT